VAFTADIAEDAARRDFTMNALYADAGGRVIDPLGGLEDALAGRVRFIGDADLRIAEDYLRILRFFRFHAQYGQGGDLDADGLDAVARNLDGLARLARERVGAEMGKLLRAPDPAPAVAAMRQSGVLARVLPGSDDAALAPLVHLEGLAGVAPDSVRRLAALGGADAAERLRLSKAEARRLDLLRGAVGGSDGAAVLGYRHGAGAALDILLLRAALLEMPLPEDARAEAARGAAAVLPVRAADLMPALEGRALGARLAELEERWIASGFTLDRAGLLGG
jgi:poly(A) polymerase